MYTTLIKRGRAVVPAPIRKRYDLYEGNRLVWLDDGQTIKVIPVPADAIGALGGRGWGKGLVKESHFGGSMPASVYNIYQVCIQLNIPQGGVLSTS